MAWKKYTETYIKCHLNPPRLEIQSTHFTTLVNVIYHTAINIKQTGNSSQWLKRHLNKAFNI